MMYVFDKGRTLKYLESEKGWKVESRETIMETAGSGISAVLPSLYKNSLDTWIEKRSRWINKERDKEVKLGKLCKVQGNNIYKLVKIIDTPDLSLNILSVEIKKEEEDRKYLTKEECEKFGIAYQKGLIPLSIWMSLIPYDPIIDEFDPLNMATYETSSLENHKNTIRYILIKLKGFDNAKDKEILKTPQGVYIDTELFLISLKVSWKFNIPAFSNLPERNKGEDIRWSIIQDSFTNSIRPTGEICDSSGCIYLILDITKNGEGIKPQALEGYRARDLFEIEWDVSFSNKPNNKTAIFLEDKMSVQFENNIFEMSNDLFWRSVKDGKYIPLVKQKE